MLGLCAYKQRLSFGFVWCGLRLGLEFLCAQRQAFRLVCINQGQTVGLYVLKLQLGFGCVCV
jgi:hypothetical protein